MADAMGLIKIKTKNIPEFTHPNDGCLPSQSVTLGSYTLSPRMLPLLKALLEFLSGDFLQNLWHIIKRPISDSIPSSFGV